MKLLQKKRVGKKSKAFSALFQLKNAKAVDRKLESNKKYKSRCCIYRYLPNICKGSGKERFRNYPGFS
jgi:hypothetical protein